MLFKMDFSTPTTGHYFSTIKKIETQVKFVCKLASVRAAHLVKTHFDSAHKADYTLRIFKKQ